MLRKRRTVPLRRTLKIEALEERTLLTGNVTVFLDLAGTLHITGDAGGVNAAFPEAVQILDSSPPGLPNLTFRVQGRPGTFTSVNGVQFIDFVGSSIQSVVAQFPGGPPGLVTFNALDIIGQFPSAPTSGTSFPGNVSVSSNGGSTSLSISNLTTNSVSLFGGANTASDSVTLNNVKMGQLLAFTGTGADKYNITGSVIPIAQISTLSGNDNVTIAGSTLGSLTSTSTTGNNTYNIAGNSITKAVLNIGTAGGTGADSVTFSSNTILQSAAITVGTGGTVGPANGSVLGQHQINVNSNIQTLPSGGLTLTVGDSSRATSGAASNIYDQTQVFMNSNRVGGSQLLQVGANALNVQANGNTVSKNLTATVGDGSGFRLGGISAPGSVQVSSDIVGGLLGVTVGGSTVNQITSVILNQDQAGTLGVVIGNGSGNSTALLENVSITNINLTTATAAPNAINVGVANQSFNTTISNLFSPVAPVNILVGSTAFNTPGGGTSFIASGGGGGTVNLNQIVTDNLVAAVGSLFSNVLLTNSQTTPDANGAGDMKLSVGNSNLTTGLNVTATGDNIGNAIQGNFELDQVAGGASDLTFWTVSNIQTFDWNMAAGDAVPSTNIANLSNIKVTDSMVVQFSVGFNGVQATNVVVSPGFGFINGGGNPGSVYVGSPTNFGFVVFGFGAYF
jgi:hypothetical protein